MKLTLFILFFLIGCQDYNSNTFDATLYPPNSNYDEADPNFAPAYTVIKAKCINCHEGAHNDWAEYVNNQAWIDSANGDIVKNSASSSELVRRIINSGGAGADMPKGGTSLPNDEYQLIRDWIDNMP